MTAVRPIVPMHDLLKDHAFRGGWKAGMAFMPREFRLGRWRCACGTEGPLGQGEGILAAWRLHLAVILEEEAVLRSRNLLDLATTRPPAPKSYYMTINPTPKENTQ